jgi:hypothetical protein
LAAIADGLFIIALGHGQFGKIELCSMIVRIEGQDLFKQFSGFEVIAPDHLGAGIYIGLPHLYIYR